MIRSYISDAIKNNVIDKIKTAYNNVYTCSSSGPQLFKFQGYSSSRASACSPNRFLQIGLRTTGSPQHYDAIYQEAAAMPIAPV